MRKKRNNTIDWIKIKNDYIHSKISIPKLAKKYKVSERQITRHSVSEEWVKLRAENEKIVAEESHKKLQEKEIARKVAKNEKHIELYEEGIELVEKLLGFYKQKLADSNANKVKLSPDKLEKIFTCIEKAQKGQRLALNMEDKSEVDDMPKMIMVENLDLNKI